MFLRFIFVYTKGSKMIASCKISRGHIYKKLLYSGQFSPDFRYLSIILSLVLSSKSTTSNCNLKLTLVLWWKRKLAILSHTFYQNKYFDRKIWDLILLFVLCNKYLNYKTSAAVVMCRGFFAEGIMYALYVASLWETEL